MFRNCLPFSILRTVYPVFDTGQRAIVLRRVWTEKGKTNRLSDGNVPTVNYNPDNGKVYVNANDPQNANDNVRFRREVSREGALCSFLRHEVEPAVCHL